MSAPDTASSLADTANGLRSASGSGEARDFAIIMAYDAFRICLGQTPQHNSCEAIMQWMALMSDKPLVSKINTAIKYPPHKFKAHKKYPWFCADCGYAPHDEIKHIQENE